MDPESLSQERPRSPTRTGALIGAAVGLLLFLPMMTIPELATLTPFQESMYRLLSVLSFPYPAIVGTLSMDLFGVGDPAAPGLVLLIGASAVGQCALYGLIIGRVTPRRLGVAAVAFVHVLGILYLA